MKTRNKQIVYRSVQFRAETRTEGEKIKRIIRGYPILFNVETTVYDYWNGEIKEVILPTALDGVNLDNLVLIKEHYPDILGRNGVNMRVSVDETGLFFECELPDTQLGRDTYTEIEMGLVDGMSFGAYISDRVNPETKKRTITHFDELFEISTTIFPVYKEASVIAQNQREDDEAADAAKKEQEEKEREEFIKFMEDI
ncbi:MAG: HK97 family phage prohead protease [Clostridia bacterium]|nr:HK97 family phage prohead protease [Clostridia bacterium]